MVKVSMCSGFPVENDFLPSKGFLLCSGTLLHPSSGVLVSLFSASHAAKSLPAPGLAVQSTSLVSFSNCCSSPLLQHKDFSLSCLSEQEGSALLLELLVPCITQVLLQLLLPKSPSSS